MTQGSDGKAERSAAGKAFPGIRYAKRGCRLVVALWLGCCAQAWAINKCVVDGKTIYQDAPCEADRETVAQAMERKERNEMLHRKLDMLAAQGQGMVQRTPTSSQKKRERTEDEVRSPRRTRAEIRADDARAAARYAAESERRTAESVAEFTRLMDEATKACGGSMEKYPKIGMSDENFRLCTTHARLGGITQVVVSEDGTIPLRLYIFPSGPARRVYTIGGVVTAIRDGSTTQIGHLSATADRHLPGRGSSAATRRELLRHA